MRRKTGPAMPRTERLDTVANPPAVPDSQSVAGQSSTTIININHPIDKLLTIEEMAAYLQVKPRTVESLTARGLLKRVKLGRLVRYDPRMITAR